MMKGALASSDSSTTVEKQEEGNHCTALYYVVCTPRGSHVQPFLLVRTASEIRIRNKVDSELRIWIMQFKDYLTNTNIMLRM